MLIAIDLDEVLFDTMDMVIERHNKIYGTNYQKSEFNSHDWWEVWGGTKEDSINEMYEFVDSEYHDRIKPKKWAKECLKKISKRDDIIAVTGRAIDFEEKTLKLIEDNFGALILRTYFCNDYTKNGVMFDKSEIVNRERAELIIEDNMKYANECVQQGIRVFLFNAPWNQELPPNGVERVYSWYHVGEKLGFP